MKNESKEDVEAFLFALPDKTYQRRQTHIKVPKKNKEIICALENGNNSLTMELLMKDPGLSEAQTTKGESLLCYAESTNNIVLTKLLLDLGTYPNHVDIND